MGRSTSLALAVTLVTLSALSAQSQTADRRLTRDDAVTERRLALVVGNNAYPRAPLRNAVADATSVSTALRDAGFDVTTITDADLPTFERAVDAFAARLQKTDIALFFYSGHGMQVDGDNYLLPVDFRGVDEADAKARSYSATRLQEKLEARARIRLLILDACRDNPFKTSRSGQGGLSAMQGRGSLIAFATAAGSTASDNPRGKNGLFTEQLLEVLGQPGLSSRDVFFKVRERVNEASGGKQFPWVSDGLIGDFVFRAGNARPAVVDEALNRREELAFWETIGQTKDPKALTVMLEEYTRRYPGGRFSVLARARLTDVSSAATLLSVSGTVKLRADQVSSASLDALVSDCDAGHGAACWQTGERYYYGIGTAENAAKAVEYYRRACDGGHATGCYSLAVAYEHGRGVTADRAKAMELDRKACAGGDVDGCNAVKRLGGS